MIEKNNESKVKSKKNFILGGLTLGTLAVGTILLSKNKKVRSKVKEISNENEILSKGISKGREVKDTIKVKSLDVSKKVSDNAKVIVDKVKTKANTSENMD